MTIQLIDRNEEMCNQWKSYFEGIDDVIVHQGDFFSLPTDCVVSPANSFGFMDGGLDAAITAKLGRGVQNRIQDRLKQSRMGELLVGQAMLVESDNKEIPYCISAPTMRVPMILKNTPNVYLAAKAIFALIKDIEDAMYLGNCEDIDTITISGLGTGVGQVPYDICAKQMKIAYDEVYLEKYVPQPTWHGAQMTHQALYTKSFRDLQFDEDNE